MWKRILGITLALLMLWPLAGCSKQSDDNVLHIAATFESSDLTELVEQFNQSSDEYTAVIDYYPDNSFDRLCTEILSGDGPDIFNLWCASIPTDSPYLEDLYPYIDADPELSRDTFVPTALLSLDSSGHLRSIAAEFVIATLIVSPEDVDGSDHWTFPEMQSFLERKGEAYHLFPQWMDRSEFLLWIATISTGSFIDWDTRTAQFDGADFQDYLRFCKEQGTALPEGGDTARVSWPYLADLGAIQNVTVINHLPEERGGQPFTFIGFPSSNSSGSFFESGELHLGMSANSNKKEAAWQFIRLALMPEYQEKIADTWLPIRYDTLTSVLDDNIEDASYKAQIWQLINQPHSFTQSNLSLLDIIQEEAGDYFNDTKSLEEVCHLIQNRVTLYLHELG